MNTKLLPLALLAADSGEPVEGITRFQKLVFLAQEELSDSDEFYDFEPHKYGPFSKSLYDDIDQLVLVDSLTRQKTGLSLATNGRNTD